MNTAKIKKALLLAIGGAFVWWAWKSPAQDVPAATTSLQMPYAVTQVLELEQAKVGEPTVIAYIRSSGTSYNLNVTQIVFLRQQGVSDAVITAMLTQPRTDVSVAAQAAAPAPAPQYASAPEYAPPQYASATSAGDMADSAVVAQPPVTYMQTPPVYYNYSYNYPYPSYAWYGWPFCWTWYGGGWHWGWHGGSVGWHGGGGWHGTWGGGWHGGSVGGWHGGWTGHGSWGGGSHGGWGGGHGGGHR
jgi:hypothetical protein